MAAEALSGLRVIEFGSGRAGGLATTVLADFGAVVIKVEPPGGDRFRSMASSPMWLRGKQSVELDLHQADDLDRARALAQTADVVVIAAPPDRIRGWGLDADSLRQTNPRLVHCAITGWGMTGPYSGLPGYEALVAAKTGRMASFDVQLDEGRPIYAAVQVATHVASQTAVHGILAALHDRESSGAGARVETSLFQALMPFDLIDTITHQRTLRDGGEFIPLRRRSAMPTLNYHPIQASDGVWLQCGNLLEHLFYSFLGAIDLLGDMLADDRFQDSPAAWSAESIEVARDLILTRVKDKTAAEWMDIFFADGNVAAEPVVATDQALAHRDLVEGHAIVVLEDEALGPVTQIGPLAELVGTPAQVSQGAPLPGRHAPGVLESVTTPQASASLDNEATPHSRPLHDLTILDLSTIIAGPLGISMLADLGARVIKVEPYGGDPFRHLLPGGLMAVKTNQGKESICIDLKTPAGQAILHELVVDADVLVHNFRGDVPAKLGIGYEQLSAINPQLIWAVINGYGPHGPGAKRPATHPVMGAAAGGVAYQAGDAITRDCPTIADTREAARQIMAANDSNPDPNTSVVAATSILLAVAARDRHRVGQRVNINMQVANAWANSDDFLSYAGKPARPPIDSGRHGLDPLYRLYPTLEGWVFLAAPTDADFAKFAAEVGDPALASPDFVTAPRRARHEAQLIAAITAALSTRTADEWETSLALSGIGCVRADGIEVGAVFHQDPHIIANGWAPGVDHPRFGSFRRWGPTVTVDGVRDTYPTAPLAGEHTDRILAELGRSRTEIETLRHDRVVNSEAP